jgi:hypothetical protein
MIIFSEETYKDMKEGRIVERRKNCLTYNC